MLGATSGSAVSPSVCGSASGTSVSNLGDINTPGSSSTPSELGEIEAATVVAPTTKEKGKEVAEDKPAENEKKTLVDLPVDVLKDIVKEVNNTNDLVSLSLTCRCLHALSVPNIYSRFDIVWPHDTDAAVDRSGVDALTYGLATLVAAGRRGNDYARWVRKFSLGNGPADWVREYNITREGGKMLGTLVTLAISRMQNLEKFNWDMPTGILREVFMALHDLCPQSLREVHVRFHDNSKTTTATSQDAGRRVETPTFKGFSNLRYLSVLDIDERQYLDEMAYALDNSVTSLKHLRIGLANHVRPKGKWIWDLDEVPAVVDDLPITYATGAVGGVLGVLVSRFCELQEKKKKVRDIQTSATNDSTEEATTTMTIIPTTEAPAAPVVGTNEPLIVFTDPPTASVTGTAVNTTATTEGTVFEDMSQLALGTGENATENPSPTFVLYDTTGESESQSPIPLCLSPNIVAVSPPTDAVPPEAPSPTMPAVQVEQAVLSPSEPSLVPETTTTTTTSSTATIIPDTTITPPETTKTEPLASKAPVTDEDEKPIKQLKLETLEFEQVPISTRVLLKAFDWTTITSLTILKCHNHERLWKALRRKYSPYSSSVAAGIAAAAASPYIRPGFNDYQNMKMSNQRKPTAAVLAAYDYKIRLKKLHTDRVSAALINFVKETIPPNSLEILIFQENPVYNQAYKENSPSQVSMDTIFKGAIKRHRTSLKKLLVDSNCGTTQYESDKWRFGRDVLTYITSGKMTSLRELGFSIDYRDWHYFITRLPLIYHLRSLYIPHVRGPIHLSHAVSKEMALQIVDIVTLRPEVEICYVGIRDKCYELLEGDDESDLVGNGAIPADIDASDDEDGDEDDEEDEDEDDEDMEGEGDDDDEVVDISDDEDDGPNIPPTPANIQPTTTMPIVVVPGVQGVTLEEGSDETHILNNDISSSSSSLSSITIAPPAKPKDSTIKVKLREILFYDDKVAVFKARNGRL